MWTTNQLGLAVWEDGGSRWQFDARGEGHGIGMVNADGSQNWVKLESVDDKPLPAASEQFIRGRRWRINYPQQGGQFAIRLSLEPIQSDSDSLVLEATISIQTDLLDSHPVIDLVAEGNELHAFETIGDTSSPDSLIALNDADSENADSDDTAHGSPAIASVRSGDCTTTILLGPHDSPFTQNLSGDGGIRYRLFGDFLEKGVIRTARPWIVIDRAPQADGLARLETLYRRLCESPLPLA